MPSQEDYLNELLQHIGDDEKNENGDPQDAIDALSADTLNDLEAALGADGDLDISSLLDMTDDPGLETAQVPEAVSELGVTDELLEDAMADLEAALNNEEGLGTDAGEFVETELEEAVISDLEAAAEEAVEEAMLMEDVAEEPITEVFEEAAAEEPAIEEFQEAAAEEPAIEEFQEADMSELENAAVEAMGEPALGAAAIGEFEEAAVEEPAVEEFAEAVIAELEDAAVEATGESALGEPAMGEFEETALEEPVIEEFGEATIEESNVEESNVEEPILEESTVEEPNVEEPNVEEPILEESTVEEPIVEEPTIEEPTVKKPATKAPMEFDLNKMVENLDEPTVDDILEEMALRSEEMGPNAIPEEAVSIVGGDSKPELEEEARTEQTVEAEVLDSETDDDEIKLDDLLAQQAKTALSEMEEPVLGEGNGDLADLMGEGAPDLDAVSSMSEAEIDKLLAAGAQEAAEEKDTYDESQEELPDDEDVLSILDDTDDSELQEIQDLLQKADNNEAVDEEIEALLQEPAEEENPAKKLLAEDEEKKPDQVDAKTQKAQEKEQKRREKAEAKKAAKEAKAAAKKAKAAAKAGAAVVGATAAAGAGAALAENTSTDRETGVDDMFDTSVLDSIVSEADQAGMGDAQPVSEEGGIMEDTDLLNGEEDILAGMDEMIGMDTENSGGEKQENDGEASDDDLDFDMGSLFGNDVGVGDLGAGSDVADGAGESRRNDSDFPDFVEQSIMPKEAAEGKKKKGLFARFLDFLTEEEEEDEEVNSLQLSDENKDVLNQLDNEKTSGKKKKKKKGADEEDGKDKKAAKPKKEKKPKPEKPKKEKVVEPGPLIPERKLTLKRVMPVVLVCLSLGVLIIVFSNASVDYTTRQNARDAYYDGDYQTCFENLYGKNNLSETEQIMFGTSESILRMQLWMKEYEMFVEEGAEVEALDSLIQTVYNYPELYEYALKWNAGDQVMAGYTVVLNVLGDKYGLTEEQALEIAAVHSDREYTRRIVTIVLGGGRDSWDAPASTNPSEGAEPAPLPDELPEEGELDNSSFIDNQ